MLRRCVSVLLILGVLASQLAAVAHAHRGSGETDQKHDETAHFHWGGHHGEDHHHGHSHAGDGHHHNLNRQDESSDRTPDDESISPPAWASSADHDADAIYLPSDLRCASTVTPSKKVTSVLEFALPMPLPVAPSGGEHLHLNRLKSRWRWRPPDEVLDGSDMYLMLRNLRL